VIAPAPADNRNGSSGFSPKDLTWILSNSPTETVVLKPPPAGQEPVTIAAFGRNTGKAA
jgi:hypothetical protein